MWRQNLTSSIWEAGLLTLLVLFFLSLSHAQVRTSTSYQLQSDSINFAGGNSTSTNYDQESTMGEVATGVSTSSSYTLGAGFQQMQAVFISLSAVAPVVMTPAIGGLSGGTANGSTTVTVVTDSPGGYELTIAAEQNPAMQKGVDTIADYTPLSAPNPDVAFSVTTSDVHFGFAVHGVDVVSRFWNNTTVCNAGTGSTPEACWDGLAMTPQVIAAGATNQPLGATTTVYFRVGIGGAAAVTPGTYVATTTITALPL